MDHISLAQIIISLNLNSSNYQVNYYLIPIITHYFNLDFGSLIYLILILIYLLVPNHFFILLTHFLLIIISINLYSWKLFLIIVSPIFNFNSFIKYFLNSDLEPHYYFYFNQCFLNLKLEFCCLIINFFILYNYYIIIN